MEIEEFEKEQIMIGVFARPDHPPGYGMPGREGENGLRAHGYIVVFVNCPDEQTLQRVRDKLRLDGLNEPFGHTYAWYGGRMDLVGVVPEGSMTQVLPDPWFIGHKRVSLGDNRFTGIYEATEILR